MSKNKEEKLKRAAKEVAEAMESVKEASEAVAAPIEPKPAPTPKQDAVRWPDAKYVVQWPIKRDGRRYSEGDSIDLSAADAEPFLASGAIAPRG